MLFILLISKPAKKGKRRVSPTPDLLSIGKTARTGPFPRPAIGIWDNLKIWTNWRCRMKRIKRKNIENRQANEISQNSKPVQMPRRRRRLLGLPTISGGNCRKKANRSESTILNRTFISSPNQASVPVPTKLVWYCK